MSRGRSHENMNLRLLIVASAYLGHLFWGNLTGMLLSLVFILKWIWNMYYWTPDVDILSRASVRLGFVGKITRYLLDHRGISHSFILWSVVFAVEYLVFGWPCLGGTVPIFSHLIMDKF